MSANGSSKCSTSAALASSGTMPIRSGFSSLARIDFGVRVRRTGTEAEQGCGTGDEGAALRRQAVRLVVRGERALAAALERQPALLWIETPSNPLLRIVDIEARAGAAQG